MGRSICVTLRGRSTGKRVLVCAASAKTARLIGGHTVHSAFRLRLSGGFFESQLNGTQKQTAHWASQGVLWGHEISRGGCSEGSLKQQLLVEVAIAWTACEAV